MPRQRTGSVTFNRQRRAWVARLDWVDENGRARCRKQQVENKTAGKELCKRWIRELAEHGEQIIDGERMTFAKLAKIYEEKKLFAPVYQGDVKVAGLRAYVSLKNRLKTLVEYFGAKRARLITHSDIEQYKLTRQQIKTCRGGERTAADINRDLQLLRAILNFARRQGWLTRNPFEQGEPLISIANEVKRERVLSRAEEARLLAACHDQRAHLKPILICALDTACRRGEIFQLRWKDVDLIGGEINVRATTTKTMKARSVPVSARLGFELQRLKEAAPDDPEGRVFGITSDIKKGFAVSCREAGVKGFRLHDCRHTAITRWIQQGMPPMQVMAISGHTQMTTFARYVNADRQAIRRAAEAMNAFHAEAEAQQETIN